MEKFERKNIVDRRGGDRPVLVVEERRSGKDRRDKTGKVFRKIAKKFKKILPPADQFL